MSLLDIVRSGVKIANDVTKPLQATVMYRQLATSDQSGPQTWKAAVPLKAIVDWKQRQLRTQSGTLSVSRAMVMFVDIAALTTATGGVGIGDQDLIVLPDGTTGPIIDMGGFIDAGTGIPFATEVYLG